ncbi:hypothetical protein D3C85_1201930 [compost metagenome]
MWLANTHHQQRTDGAGADGQGDGQRHDGHVLLHVVGLHRRFTLGHAQRGNEQHATGADAKSIHRNSEYAEDRPPEQVQQHAGNQHGDCDAPRQLLALLAGVAASQADKAGEHEERAVEHEHFQVDAE